MSHVWEPEQTIEPPLALALVQEQFPNLKAKTIRLLGAGWDNTAYIVNEELIFRFPRRAIALPLLEMEATLLPKLVSKLPLPIPNPQWKGVGSKNYPWPFIGYKMVPGFTACYANLSEEARHALAIPLAQFLKTLHQIPASEIPSGDNFNRIEGKSLTEKIRKTLDEIALLNLFHERKKLEKVIERAQDFRAPVFQAIVHGDLYVRHLLVDEKHALCGVIDWGDVHLGDPAIDLAIVHAFLPKSAHEDFFATYGTIDTQTSNLALLRAIYSSAYIVLFGFHSRDPDILREGLRSLNHLS